MHGWILAWGPLSCRPPRILAAAQAMSVSLAQLWTAVAMAVWPLLTKGAHAAAMATGKPHSVHDLDLSACNADFTLFMAAPYNGLDSW